jgi:ABC-type transport system involved in multi-copper enzyme maturation permease subunit
MARAWIVAKNTLLEIGQRRLIYFVAALVFVNAVSLIRMLSNVEQAELAGEVEFASGLPPDLITNVLVLWDTSLWLLTCFLGATVISAETKSRAVITTLARPLTRHEFLAGKAIGVIAAAVALFTIPFGLSLFGAWWFGVDLTWGFWLGLAQAVTVYIAMGTMTVALAAVWSPMAAGVTTLFVLPMARSLGESMTGAPNPVWAAIGYVLYGLTPAATPHKLMVSALDSSLIEPAYGLVALVMLENLGYAAVLFALAAWVFARREIGSDG